MVKDTVKNPLNKAKEDIFSWKYESAIDLLNGVLIDDLENLKAYHLKWLALIQLWNISDAKINFERILEISPKNKTAYRELSVIFLDEWDYNNSLSYAKTALRFWDKTEVTYVSILSSLFSLNQLNEFEDFLEIANDKFSNSATFNFELWIIYSESDYKKSINFFKKSYELNNPDNKLDYFISLAYKNANLLEEALFHADIVMSLNPHFFEGYILKQEILTLTWDLNELNLFLKQALLIFPENNFFIFSKAKTLLNLGDISSALDEIKKIEDFEENPDYIELYLVCLFVNFRFEELINYCENNFIETTVMHHRMLAESYFMQWKYDSALVVLLEAKNKNIYISWEIISDLIACYSALWDFDLALDLLDEELKNNPTDKLILKAYFKLFYDISDYETALSFYAKNKDILENENDILLKVSEIYLYRHNPERAIQIVSFGLIKFPNFIDFYQIRATSYLMQNNLKLAINDLKKSLKIDKNNLKSLNFLLKLYKQNEDFKNALKIVDKLITLTDENNSLLNQKLILTFKAWNYDAWKDLFQEFLDEDIPFNDDVLATLINFSEKENDLDYLDEIIDFFLSEKDLTTEFIYLISLAKGTVLWKTGAGLDILEKNFSLISPDVNYYSLMVDYYKELWYFDKSLALLDLAIEIFPTQSSFFLSKSLILIEKKSPNTQILNAINSWIEYSKDKIEIKSKLFELKSDIYYKMWEINHSTSIIQKALWENKNAWFFSFSLFKSYIILLLKLDKKDKAKDVVLNYSVHLTEDEKLELNNLF